ncbi:MAG: DUF1749 domain-containing protein [Candidatus Aenigmarchaeota archaeon]|nr:DUF1749 domain-containing protein [Candidatus Aenigmarchaeota archaeon]
MALGEIVKFSTKDGIELQGVLADAKSTVGLLHVHGLAGNFYENSFLDTLADAAAGNRITFLSMNTRGHDYVNDLVRFDGKKHKIINIGGALERFEDCLLDIQAGISVLKSRGCTNIVLQGHSSGCQKIAYYHLETKDPSVTGMVLLAPADDMTIVRNMLGNKFGAAMKKMKKLVKSCKGATFMPQGLLGLPVLSAGRLYSLCNPASIEARLFNYEGPMKEISKVSVPVLAIFGEKDTYLTQPATDLLRIMKSKATGTTCDTAVIKGAPHNFRGHEEQLVGLIIPWIRKH